MALDAQRLAHPGDVPASARAAQAAHVAGAGPAAEHRGPVRAVGEEVAVQVGVAGRPRAEARPDARRRRAAGDGRHQVRGLAAELFHVAWLAGLEFVHAEHAQGLVAAVAVAHRADHAGLAQPGDRVRSIVAEQLRDLGRARITFERDLRLGRVRRERDRPGGPRHVDGVLPVVLVGAPAGRDRDRLEPLAVTPFLPLGGCYEQDEQYG